MSDTGERVGGFDVLRAFVGVHERVPEEIGQSDDRLAVAHEHVGGKVGLDCAVCVLCRDVGQHVDLRLASVTSDANTTTTSSGLLKSMCDGPSVGFNRTGPVGYWRHDPPEPMRG
ncbi:hypothetical protein MPRF_26350 [Mycolicibacterium parafortuitum]|uniref:Uncharacterized protein n=1 Tax=Mycolicibacterium parafortuitum TaxID=39692 RepID=A0A7I7U5R6_MYCPF|nr:hypothetical protein MPRF_26350 [Mycolicibacterium parafortuitum]